MTEQPTLLTKRLSLRPFGLEDARRVQELAGDERIADVTANIPHPYPDGLAKRWIREHPQQWQRKESVSFAIQELNAKRLFGCISLVNITEYDAEVGYWLGVEFWNQGYATEACRAVIGFAFNGLGLKRVHAHHLSRNPASGRVLLKAGLTHLGSESSPCGFRSDMAEEQSIERYEIVVV